MTISSIGNNPATLSMQFAGHAASGSEAHEVGPDIDGDADDSGAKAVSAAARPPAVNSSGQTVGTLIHVTA